MADEFEQYEPHVANSGFVWECQKCGSLVGKRNEHNKWHSDLRQAIVDAASSWSSIQARGL